MTDDNAHVLLAAKRREHVLDALARDGAVRISQLVDDLGVTPVTLRRDLAQMEREGVLVRVHGGAVPSKAAAAAASVPKEKGSANGRLAITLSPDDSFRRRRSTQGTRCCLAHTMSCALASRHLAGRAGAGCMATRSFSTLSAARTMRATSWCP